MSHSNIPRRLCHGNYYLGYASTIYLPDALDSNDGIVTYRKLTVKRSFMV